MPDIYKVDSSKIVGGPGRLVVKPYDGTFPQSIEEVMNTASPYDLLGAWRDLGSTNEGIVTSRGFETEEFSVDQVVGAVDEYVSAWSHTSTTNLAENTIENRQLALVGGTIIDTPAQIGTATTLTSDTAINASILNVTSAAGITAGSFLQVSEGENTETRKVNRVQGTTIYLESGLQNAYTAAGASVAPVTALATKRIGYGTPGEIPLNTFALISQKKDGSLYMAVLRKAKVNGDEKEQTYSSAKRLLPLTLTLFPDDNAPENESVYYEIEQVIS